MVLKDPTAPQSLTYRQILKLAELHNFVSQTPEQREQAKKDQEFEAWAKQVKQNPKWVPTPAELGTSIRK